MTENPEDQAAAAAAALTADETAALDAVIQESNDEIVKLNQAMEEIKGRQTIALLNMRRATGRLNIPLPETARPVGGRTPDGPLQPPPAQKQRNETDFLKSIRSFRYGDGDNFQAWKSQVVGLAKHFNIDDDVQKNFVYLRASDGANYSLVRLLDPEVLDKERVKNGQAKLTATEYMAMLEEQFEPIAESENMKLEFQARHQMPNELPLVYYTDKKSMYLRAHPENQRDWSAFFDQAISGLSNARMREKLREVDLVPSEANAHKLGNEIVRWARIVRKSFQLGELSEAEVYGAEANPSTFSYIGGRTLKGLVLKPDGTPIKSEPIHTIHAVSAKGAKGPCWHCKGPHLIKDCPRKTTGFPASVAAVDEEAVHATTDPSARGGRKVFRPFRRGGRGRGFKRVKERVATLFEDEQGNAYYDIEGEEECEPTVAAVDGATAAPPAPEDDEDFGDNDDGHFLEVLGL